jgi:hypothetical protein
MPHPRPLRLEQLEDRTTPSTFGLPWPDPLALTISFAPDGTSAAGTPSNLFSRLNAKAPTPVWETVILRAFQTWAAKANLNVLFVTDGGEPFGTPGKPQGDLRFGDIRVGMAPLGTTALATAGPFLWSGTTWSGDNLFNSQADFSVAGGPVQYDLYSVALHEAGHVLGLGANDDPRSVMYDAYQNDGAGPAAEDVQAVQALYGPRLVPLTLPVIPIPVPSPGLTLPGLNTGLANPLNDTPALATPVLLLPTVVGQPQWNGIVPGMLGSLSGVDFYKVTPPLAYGNEPYNLLAMVWGTDTASVSARIDVYDAFFRPVAEQVIGNDHGSSPCSCPTPRAASRTTSRSAR